MTIIQSHPHTDDCGSLVGIIRGTGKNIYTDYSDGDRYIDAWNRVSYLYSVNDDRKIWASAPFKIISKDPKIIERVSRMHVYNKGDLVLCQNNTSFSPDMIIYETMQSLKKYSINKITLDELFELKHFKKLFEPYRGYLDESMRFMQSN